MSAEFEQRAGRGMVAAAVSAPRIGPRDDDIAYEDLAPVKLRTGPSRVLSLLLLAAVLLGLAQAGTAVFRALTDAVVAPTILSPNNDAVIQSKLTLSRLLTERAELETKLARGRTLLEADDKALQIARQIATEAPADGETVKRVGVREEQRRAGQLVLDRQRFELEQALRSQERYVAQLEHDFEAGLIRQADLEREKGKLSEGRVAILENQRDSITSREHWTSAGVDDLRAYLELIKLEADHKGRLLEQASNEEAVARLDSLLKAMRARPVYRATESNQNVAFVPYEQLEGVKPGAVVYQCTLWGLFNCKQVGRVADLLSGEVINPEAWSGESRGQYALLDLTDPLAARSRSLRVREPSEGFWAAGRARVGAR